MTYFNKITNSQTESGSSLLGLALFMVAFGFLIMGGIAVYQNYDLVLADQKTIDHSKDIEDAIMAFVEREERFPCPAPLNAPLDTPEFGREISTLTGTNCNGGTLNLGALETYRLEGRAGLTVRLGAVPTRSLNLPDYKMFDGHGKRYYYAITEQLASDGSDGLDAANVHSDYGAISIHNENGEHISEEDGHIVYALMSMGEDDRGAFNEDGVLLAPCDETTLAGTNCRILNLASADATFITTMDKSYNIDDNFSHSFAYYANSVPYRWITRDWGPCEGVCVQGERIRDVFCQNRNGENVSFDNCVKHLHEKDTTYTPAMIQTLIEANKPAEREVCPLKPCYWAADWGEAGMCMVGTGITSEDYLQEMADWQEAVEWRAEAHADLRSAEELQAEIDAGGLPQAQIDKRRDDIEEYESNAAELFAQADAQMQPHAQRRDIRANEQQTELNSMQAELDAMDSNHENYNDLESDIIDLEGRIAWNRDRADEMMSDTAGVDLPDSDDDDDD